MIIFEIIGILTFLYFIYKLVINFIGYSWSSCPNDHDTMARQGAKYCNKCKNEL